MKRLDTKKMIEFNPYSKNSFIIFDAPEVRLALFCSEPGQGVKKCRSSSRVMMTVLEGKGAFLIDNEEINGGPGSVIIWEPGESHGYVAKTRLVFLATIAPGHPEKLEIILFVG